MTAVLQFPSHLPSSPPSPPFSCTPNDGPRPAVTHIIDDDPLTLAKAGEKPASGEKKGESRRTQQEQQLSLLAFLLAVIRKSLVGCSTDKEKGLVSMEISWPTNVRHIAHVTFDRFHGFLGLPAEFEPEVPRKAPSASASVFGVSTKSMQCSYDSRGNSVPTILLLMQRRLYAQGGLQAEGIFRINAENSQEEHVRDLLNNGIVPDGIDVHCLAGLIKAWFRELPTGILDSLTSEEVMQCKTEKECVRLVKLLPQTEAALLDWAINLMADVVQEEHHNKMNARNVAVVFAPNMTQMVDPLTALMYAVQVMNFLKTLVERTLRERQESAIEAVTASPEHSDESGHHNPSRVDTEGSREEETEHVFVVDQPVLDSPTTMHVDSFIAEDPVDNSQINARGVAVSEGAMHLVDNQQCEISAQVDIPSSGSGTTPNSISLMDALNFHKKKNARSGNRSHKKGVKKVNRQSGVQASAASEKFKGVSLVSRINSKPEGIEAWR